MGKHTKLLPVGAYVRVTEPSAALSEGSYIAKVVGYDIGGTKYQVGRRYAGMRGWLFDAGGDWTFPSWCEQITEAEATRIDDSTEDHDERACAENNGDCACLPDPSTPREE
jgi:hypothetical protein